MEIDETEEDSSRKSNALRNLNANCALPISIAKLSGSSRIIPSQKDFHFYNNFHEFKNPVKETDGKSKNLLKEIGELENLFGKAIEFPDDRDVELDDDVASDWLVNVNDELYERIDASLDEFKRLRKKEEETGRRIMRNDDDHDLGNGFQVVYGKKNKKLSDLENNAVEGGVKGAQEVKMASKVKPKIPFHIPTIPRPQDEYKIIVNNTNQPFEHVWLQKSAEGSRFLHPLEKLSVLEFIDQSKSDTEPAKPPPIENTPFKCVEEVKELKQLASKLRAVDEFAVDLEHNQYRSFQGMTCLMQISTRTEDFVIDTLKLRIHIGPHLREVFKDPTKRKVMHGANSDIAWLQRDFGIYVCNMFDTGQASRVLKMERHSLEYLLNHFCGVIANKEYQNADWRLRPLPREMIKYAREDTHYLLYIYDVMRTRLLNASPESDSSDPPLVEVYKRSYDICTQLYEKELLTDNSYLYIYGLHGADLNAQQLAIVSGLCEWRDIVARAEDESTGYVLPNRTLIEIAKQMPLTTSNLRRVLKSKHPYIERNLGSVVNIIRHSIQNAAAFEETVEYLKQRHLETVSEQDTLATEESEILENVEEVGKMAFKQNKDVSQDIGISDASKIATNTSSLPSVEVTVQALKKPIRAFGALLGSSGKRKFDTDKREQEESKLGQIKSTVILPFHSFLPKSEEMQPDAKESPKASEVPPNSVINPGPATGTSLEDVIILDDNSDIEESAEVEPEAVSNDQLKEQEENNGGEEDEPMSLSDLSSSFEKCLSSKDRSKGSKVVDESQPSVQVKPFDYESARKQIQFGRTPKNKTQDGSDDIVKNKKKNIIIQSGKGGAHGEATDFPQGKRRQAFPASGNRSATFRST